MNSVNGAAVATPVPVVRDRLSVVSLVYHQSYGSQPVVSDSRWARWLDQQEQPYSRRVTVKEEWTPIDAGWLAGLGAGYVVIENLEGKGLLVQPSEGERMATAAKVVEIGVAVGDTIVPTFLVRPGTSQPAEPADLSAMRLRCRSGTARCTVTVYPA